MLVLSRMHNDRTWHGIIKRMEQDFFPNWRCPITRRIALSPVYGGQRYNMSPKTIVHILVDRTSGLFSSLREYPRNGNLSAMV